MAKIQLKCDNIIYDDNHILYVKSNRFVVDCDVLVGNSLTNSDYSYECSNGWITIKKILNSITIIIDENSTPHQRTGHVKLISNVDNSDYFSLNVVQSAFNYQVYAYRTDRIQEVDGKLYDKGSLSVNINEYGNISGYSLTQNSIEVMATNGHTFYTDDELFSISDDTLAKLPYIVNELGKKLYIKYRKGNIYKKDTLTYIDGLYIANDNSLLYRQDITFDNLYDKADVSKESVTYKVVVVGGDRYFIGSLFEYFESDKYRENPILCDNGISIHDMGNNVIDIVNYGKVSLEDNICYVITILNDNNIGDFFQIKVNYSTNNSFSII